MHLHSPAIDLSQRLSRSNSTRRYKPYANFIPDDSLYVR